MLKKLKSPRRLAALAIFAVVAMSAFGFAAANTFSQGGGVAGDGHTAVSGGDVTNIHYTVNNANRITDVSFDYDPNLASTATVNVELRNSGNVVISSGSCAPGTTHEWDCNVAPNVDVAPVADIRVVTAS
jgi:hypothetical protein